MWAVARRPRWIALLLLALVLAAVFAGLGKWQLERSIANGKPLPATTETRKTLEAVTAPEEPASETIAGQKVTVTGTFVAGDTTILTGRTGVGRTRPWVTWWTRMVGRASRSSSGGPTSGRPPSPVVTA